MSYQAIAIAGSAFAGTKMMLPAATIGIPTFERSALLRRALSSALAQDYPNLWIVVSDNASQDDTAEVVASFDDPRLVYHRQAVSLGAVGNFRWLLEQSTSPFFAWLADDDTMGEGFISRCVQALVDHPDWVVACGRTVYRSSSGDVHAVEEPAVLANHRVARLWAHYWAVNCNTAMYGLIRRTALMDLPMHSFFGSDWLYTGGLAYRGKIGTAPGATAERSTEGASGDLPGLARSLGLSAFWQLRPHSWMAREIFRHIASGEAPYDDGWTARAAAAVVSGLAVELRCHLYPVAWQRVGPWAHRIRQRGRICAHKLHAAAVDGAALAGLCWPRPSSSNSEGGAEA